MFRKIFTGVFIYPLLLMMFLGCFSNHARGQQTSIPREPLQVLDASTGMPIPEVLVIPRYSSFTGISTLLGEGPGRGTYGDYLAKPFVYRTGNPFILKLPKSIGVNLVGLIFMGRGRSIRGVLVIAPGYRPLWFTSLWSVGLEGSSERRLQLTRISDNEWSLLLGTSLSPLERSVLRVNDNCSFWDIPTPCSLEIHFNRRERELVRSFLQQGRRAE